MAPPSEPSRPRRLGPFTLEEELGRGGMGAVFRARGPDGSAVALKVLERPGGDPRFAREVAALRRLPAHPHVVRLIEAGEGPPPWVAMELVEGESLEALLERGPLAPARAARLAGEVALALAHAHALGLLHRDVKPANVLLRAGDGSAVLTDFGLALPLEAGDPRLTRTGVFVGTPACMAPEQARGQREGVGTPADVWGLGAVLYRCLTGREPFASKDLLTTLAAIEAARPVPPRALAPAIPPSLEAVCLACLEADPARRPTASEVAGRLLAAPAPAPGRGPLLAVAVTVLLLSAAGAAWTLAGSPSPAAPHPAPPAAAPAPLQRLVLQPGFEDGEDAYVSEVGLYHDDGFGADDHLYLGDRNAAGQSGDMRAYLRFDLAQALPPGAEIQSARLELWVDQRGQLTSQAYPPLRLLAHDLAGPWTEGSSSHDAWLDGLAWRSELRPDLDQPEVRRDGPARDGALCETIAPPDLREAWLAFDVTRAARRWVTDPGGNRGLRLSHAEEGPPYEAGALTIMSSDHVDSALRPRLTLEYRGPPPLDPAPARRQAALEARRRLRPELDRLLAASPDPTAIPAASEACRVAPGWSRPYLVRSRLLLGLEGEVVMAWYDLERATHREVLPEDLPLLHGALASAGEAYLDEAPQSVGRRQQVGSCVERMERRGLLDRAHAGTAGLLARIGK